MSKHGRKYREVSGEAKGKTFTLSEAITFIKGHPVAKFDETVELTMILGVDPRHADQMVRASIVLPHGTGKTKRVLAIAQGDKAKEAEDAGADLVGGEEMAKKVQEGFLDFDAVVTTPDMMKHVGKLGRVLGPRGMMPNPKTGTVTMDVARAVQQIKAGKLDFRVDKHGIIHLGAGKTSFSQEQLEENLQAVIDTIIKAKPAVAKGRYIKKSTLSSTMGPGLNLDLSDLEVQ